MILILVGMQDKQFLRIFKIVDNAIKKGIIKEKVIAQTGFTKFESDNIETFDFISDKKLKNYMNDADLIITHGGIGSLTTALSYKKKIFAMPRLSVYKEHLNDHQEQIVDEFAQLGYIKKIESYDDFVREYKNIKNFKPKFPEFDNKKILNLITDFIDNN